MFSRRQQDEPQCPSLAKVCQALPDDRLEVCWGCRAGLLLHPPTPDAHFHPTTPSLPRQTFPPVGRVPFLMAERSATCLRFAEREHIRVIRRQDPSASSLPYLAALQMRMLE